MQAIKNVYALVYTSRSHPNDKAVIFHVLSEDYTTAIVKHRQGGGPLLGEDYVLKSVNLIAEDVNY